MSKVYLLCPENDTETWCVFKYHPSDLANGNPRERCTKCGKRIAFGDEYALRLGHRIRQHTLCRPCFDNLKARRI